MKKITCQAMGGTCEAEITGATAEDLMKNGKQHVHDAADSGDEDHKAVVEKMKALSTEDHDKWAADFTEKFDGLEEA